MTAGAHDAYEALRRVGDTLDELVALVETARALPLSASCVLPREQVLALLDEMRAAWPLALEEAREVVTAREELLGQARDRRDRATAEAKAQAAAILSAAKAEAERLISAAEVRRAAQAEARGILAAAEERSARLRGDADRYAEERLAALAGTLGSALRTVERGRQVLRDHTAGAARDARSRDTAARESAARDTAARDTAGRGGAGRGGAGGDTASRDGGIGDSATGDTAARNNATRGTARASS